MSEEKEAEIRAEIARRIAAEPGVTDAEVKAPINGEQGAQVHDAFAASLTEQRPAPFAGVAAAMSAEETPTAPGANINADNPNAVTATAVDHSIEGIAKAAYAKLAEELQWKGDFPAWDAISDRARLGYIEGVAHIQKGKADIAATEAHIAEQTALFNENCEKLRTSVCNAAKARTRFEEFVVEVSK